MSDEFYTDDAFRSQLDIESLLLSQMNRIAMFRDTDKCAYCRSVETIILMCPRYVRDRVFEYMTSMGIERGKYGAVPDDKIVSYDKLWVYVNELLEKQKMIWRKRTIKTFE